jgi:anti-anti-sigma factor
MPARATDGCSIRLSRRACGAVLVVTVLGTVDVSTARTLEDRFQKILHRGNLRRLVIDLSRVELFRDSGLHCLMQAQDAGNEGGIECRLVLGEGIAKRVIEARGNRGLPPSVRAVDDACQLGSSEPADDPPRRVGSHRSAP